MHNSCERVSSGYKAGVVTAPSSPRLLGWKAGGSFCSAAKAAVTDIYSILMEGVVHLFKSIQRAFPASAVESSGYTQEPRWGLI